MNKLSIKTFASAILSVFVAGSASAQVMAISETTPSMDITLDKAIEIALAENPTIKVAEKDIELKKVADKEAWQNLLPTLSADFALSHAVKVAEIRTSMGTFKMGMDGTTTAQGGVTMALPLFAPAIYQNMKLTKEDILLAQEKARSSRLDLINQVTKAYYASLLATDSRDVMMKAYKTAEENYNVVKSKYEVGLVSEYDKISAEVQMRSMSSAVVSAETGVSLSLLRLKVLMGVTADVDIHINDKLAAYESSLNMEAAMDNDLSENSALKQLDMNMALLNRANKLLKTNFMPTVAMALTGQYQSMSNQNWNIFDYHYSPSVSLAFSVSVPIFQASNWTKLKSNKIQREQLVETRTNTQRQLNMAAESYRRNMASSIAQVESNREAVKQADKAVDISSKRYEIGGGTILELNQTETARTQAELTYYQSIYDFLTNKADLMYTLGKN